MATIDQSAATNSIEQATIRKISRRFMPVIILAYFVAYIDRVNIGMMKPELSADIGLTDITFGLASGLIFIGLIFFEIPSNSLAWRFGARRWIVRVMLSWGVVVIAGSLIQTPGQLYLMRIMLGLAEAGMAPAVFLFLAQWFPGRHRARALSAFYLSVPIALACGSPLTGWLLEIMHGTVGIAGWRWVLVIEGVAAIAIAPVVLRRLSDRPSAANWLTQPERDWLESALANEDTHRAGHSVSSFRRSLIDKQVWLFAVTYLLLGYGTNALVYWMPSIVSAATVHAPPLQVGLISAIPFACAGVGIYLVGRIAERTRARLWNMLAPVLLSVLGFGAAWLLGGHRVLAIVMLCVALTGALAAQPQFWTMPTAYMRGAAAAGGIALINSVNNIGGFAGPYSFGWLKQASPSGSTSLAFLVITAAQLLAVGCILIAYRSTAGRALRASVDDGVESPVPAS